MPGLDIAITWLTEIVADEIIIPIVGAGAINAGRSLYKRLRRKSGAAQDALETAEVQVQERLSRQGTLEPPSASPVQAADPAIGPPLDQPSRAAVDRANPAPASTALAPSYSATSSTLDPDHSPFPPPTLASSELASALKNLEYHRIRGELLLKRVQISRLQQDRLTWLIWSVGFGWSVYAALTPFEMDNFTNPKLGLLLFLGANFVMGLVRIAVDASLLKSLQVELEASQHQIDQLLSK